MRITAESLDEMIDVAKVLIIQKEYGSHWETVEFLSTHNVTRRDLIERVIIAHGMQARLDRAIANMTNLINGDPL